MGIVPSYIRNNNDLTAVRNITKDLNRILDDYLAGRTAGLLVADDVLHLQDYAEYFKETPHTLKDAKRDFLKPKALKYLTKKVAGWKPKEASELQFGLLVRQIVLDLLKDRHAGHRDQKKEPLTMEQNDVASFDAFIGETKAEVKSFEAFYQNIEKSTPIYEIKLPILKMEEILHNVNQVTNDTLKRVLVSFFKTYTEYIDLVDKKKHLFKINDMAGDIMNTSRVVFNAVIFEEGDIQNIKTNVVNFAVGELHTQMPEVLNVFGIEIKPTSFLDKEAIKEVFQEAITLNETLNIMTGIMGYKYEGKFNNFHVWSDKK